MATFSMNVEAQKTSNGKKELVAYFSRSGNTKAIANHIKEKNDNARPELKEKVKNMEEYDIIFIGFPNWWGTMPMPILTFLESYKLEGKIVIPFCTHGGGGEQNCFKDFVKNTSKATNKKGFITSGGSASSARPQVEKWLKEIDVIK